MGTNNTLFFEVITEIKNPNKFFVYDENNNLIAAQPKFDTAMNYFKTGRNIYHGDSSKHERSLTNIANKLIFSNDISYSKYRENKLKL